MAKVTKEMGIMEIVQAHPEAVRFLGFWRQHRAEDGYSCFQSVASIFVASYHRKAVCIQYTFSS